jgi:hypothetical protein
MLSMRFLIIVTGALLRLCPPCIAQSVLEAMSLSEHTFEYTDAELPIGAVHYLRITYMDGGRVIPDSLATVDLSDLSEFLRSHPNVAVDLEHHTDLRGGEQLNLGLSEHRIRSVMNYLRREHGVDTLRVEAVGMGESMPLVSRVRLDAIPDREIREHAYLVNLRTLVRIRSVAGRKP